MHETQANEHVNQTRSSFLYNLTSPKNDHKLIAQIHIKIQNNNYVVKLNSQYSESYLNIDPLSKLFSEKFLSRGEQQVSTSLSHEALACELLGLRHSVTTFFESSQGQKTTLNIHETVMAVS